MDTTGFSPPLPNGTPSQTPTPKFLNRSKLKIGMELKERRGIVLSLSICLLLMLVVLAGLGGYRVYVLSHRPVTIKQAVPAIHHSLPPAAGTVSSPSSPSVSTTVAPPHVPNVVPRNVVTSTPPPPVPSNPAPRAVTIDPSTPAAIGIPGSTCAHPVQNVNVPAFSPPAHSRIYVVASADSYPINDANCLNETMQNSIASITSNAGITWSRVAYTTQRNNTVGGFVDVWSTELPASQANMAMTVTFAAPMKAEPTQVSPSGMLKVIVVDNAGASQTVVPVTLDQMNSMTSGVSATINGVPANSLVFLAVDYWNSYSTPPGVPSGQAILDNVNNQGENDTWTISSANSATSGPVTLSQTITDTSYPTDNWHAVAWAATP